MPALGTVGSEQYEATKSILVRLTHVIVLNEIEDFEATTLRTLTDRFGDMFFFFAYLQSIRKFVTRFSRYLTLHPAYCQRICQTNECKRHHTFASRGTH